MSEPKRWLSAHDSAERKDRSDRATEPNALSSASCKAAALGDLSELWGRGPWRTRALFGLGLATVGLATYWGIFAWSPELVRDVLGSQVSDPQRQAAGSRAYLLMNFTGGLLGLLCFAPLASWRGRRFAFAVYHVGAAITAPVAFLWAGSYAQAVGLLSLMAFFVLGMHAGYAIYFPELFPTRLRATGSSACINLGRVAGRGDSARSRVAGGVAGPALSGCRDVRPVLARACHPAVRARDTRQRPAGMRAAMKIVGMAAGQNPCLPTSEFGVISI